MTAKNEMDRTRRHVVGGLSAGLVAAFGGPAVAQNDVSGALVMKPQESPMSESAPVKDYPRPPFPKQEQPWPGLASKMVPRPDHGEASYQGSGRLTGRKALITGGN